MEARGPASPRLLDARKHRKLHALMTDTDCFVFTKDPDGPAYVELVAFCCSVATTMILVVRDPDRRPDGRITQKLTRLSEFRVDAQRAREWPGTQLFDHDALVYRHRVAPGLEEALAALATHLFEWVHPAAPEDPCFLREDGRALLVTTSHEGDAYLMLTAEELRALSEHSPNVAAILRRGG
jgi:hypothetical protein